MFYLPTSSFCTQVEIICGGGILCLYCRTVRILPTEVLSRIACYTTPLTVFLSDLQALCGGSFSALDNCTVVLLVVNLYLCAICLRTYASDSLAVLTRAYEERMHLPCSGTCFIFCSCDNIFFLARYACHVSSINLYLWKRLCFVNVEKKKSE